jgi:23S rRNA (cytosine1962-C5)-methyltransferase
MALHSDILLCTPQHWTDYALIDSGDREKLERFGRYILIRPEPQAVWRKALPDKEWTSMAHARYHRTKGINQVAGEAERGTWQRKPGMPDQWTIGYRYNDLNLTFRLGLTAFGHIGVFPEQASNWDFIYNHLIKSTVPSPRILNLFAYTGGASVAARAAGAEVVHVDSVKPVITWAREIMEASGLDNIRWVVEDALSFVKREVKRGNRYHGIILDPPAYGRGPDGEKWVLGDSVDELIAQCSRLLTDDHRLFVFSLYSMGFSPLIGENLVRNHFGQVPDVESGELFLPDQAGRRLPLGTFLRFGR